MLRRSPSDGLLWGAVDFSRSNRVSCWHSHIHLQNSCSNEQSLHASAVCCGMECSVSEQGGSDLVAGGGGGGLGDEHFVNAQLRSASPLCSSVLHARFRTTILRVRVGIQTTGFVGYVKLSTTLLHFVPGVAARSLLGLQILRSKHSVE